MRSLGETVAGLLADGAHARRIPVHVGGMGCVMRTDMILSTPTISIPRDGTGSLYIMPATVASSAKTNGSKRPKFAPDNHASRQPRRHKGLLSQCQQ